MAKKAKKPALGRSPLPKQTGGPHKSPFDYDRRKWKQVDPEEGDEHTHDTGRSADTGRSDDADRASDSE